MKIKELLLAIAMVLLVIVFIEKNDFNKELGLEANEVKISIEKQDAKPLLVNKENSISSDYKLKNASKPNIKFIDSATEEDKIMESIAAENIEKLFAKAKEEGINLIGTSAYRSYENQKNVYEHNVNIRGTEEAKKYAALPGQSEHQTGLSIDVTNESRWFDKSTKEAIWLENNAHRFGFILRYPMGKEEITGYNFEPWHVRYVGEEIAGEIFNKGITLEEYIENKL